MKTALTARLAVSAVSILLACGAIAQRNQDKIHQSYAFWDFEYSGGTLDLRPLLVNRTELGEVQTLTYRSRQATFSWDFARAIPFYWTIGARALEYEQGSSVPIADPRSSSSDNLAYNENVPIADGQQERSVFSALGLRIRASNAADFYIELGIRYYDTDDTDYLGILRADLDVNPNGDETREFGEAGIRARIGPSQRWELQASLYAEQYYGPRFNVGLQYNAGDSFAFGITYGIGGESEELSGQFLSNLPVDVTLPSGRTVQVPGGLLEVHRSEQVTASLKFYY